MNVNQRRGGWIAKRRGDFFEQQIEWAARRQGLKYVDIPDGCHQVSKTQLKRVQTPFDKIIAGPGGKAAFIDAKTIDSGSFSYSQFKEHQIYWLEEMAHCGFPAGYLIHHRTVNRVVFYDVKVIRTIAPRSGLHPEIGRIIGFIEDFDLRKLFQTYPLQTTEPKVL